MKSNQKFSLLYGDVIPQKNSISKLNIAPIVSSFCDDILSSEYFISVLERPLINKDEIIERRKTLKDFIDNPELLDTLRGVFTRYDRLRDDLVNTNNSQDYSENNLQNIDGVWTSLSKSALFPSTLLNFYQSIANSFDGYEISSATLSKIRDFAKEMSKDSKLIELSSIADNMRRSTPQGLEFEIELALSDSMKIEYASLVKIDENIKQSNLLSFLKKKKDTTQSANGEVFDQAKEVLCKCLIDIDTLLTNATSKIYERCYGLSEEIYFYDVCIKYIEYIEKKNVGYCYSDFATDEESEYALDICDPYLLLSDTKIIPNEYRFGNNYCGILIGGENGSGKTTFLRSIALAYIFNQAGLPICATEASLKIMNGFYLHFSSAEENFSIGDTAGRFEGEVRDISKTLEIIKPNSLLLLNEIFQTTNFEEGADGILHILNVIERMGVKYIFVTHLDKLFRQKNQSVTKLNFDLATHKYKTC